MTLESWFQKRQPGSAPGFPSRQWVGQMPHKTHMTQGAARCQGGPGNTFLKAEAESWEEPRGRAGVSPPKAHAVPSSLHASPTSILSPAALPATFLSSLSPGLSPCTAVAPGPL